MIHSDFLVIGSGIAGLLYALEVADFGSVTVLSKKDPAEGSTRYAQGGIASVISPLDSFESHIADTINAGCGLSHRDIVELVINEGPKTITRLIELGTHFDRSGESDTFALGQEGGHSYRRILHSHDATGAEIQRALFSRAVAHPNITLFPGHIGIDLITKNRDGGKPDEVLGLFALDEETKQVKAFSARATMLATGGAGKVYLYTSNPDVATGDGIAMAYRAGARIANMEFFQFHPTCLYHMKAKSFLLTEALRGEGAKLLTPNGSPFMKDYHEQAELASRDIVARAIDEVMKKTGAEFVLLDISHRDSEFIKSRFPNIYAHTKQFGFDMTKEPLPVVPAAHYCCGGVVSDVFGCTDLERLYVAGETSFTGLHGANRLASNSLLEAAVFAKRAASHTLERNYSEVNQSFLKEWDYVGTVPSSEEVLVSFFWDEVRRLMWNLVGIVRSDKRLELAKRRIISIKSEVRQYYWRYTPTPDLIELRNIIDVADIIITSALSRRESRGLHYNIDCPARDDKNFCKDSVLARAFTKHE